MYNDILRYYWPVNYTTACDMLRYISGLKYIIGLCVMLPMKYRDITSLCIVLLITYEIQRYY